MDPSLPGYLPSPKKSVPPKSRPASFPTGAPVPSSLDAVADMLTPSFGRGSARSSASSARSRGSEVRASAGLFPWPPVLAAEDALSPSSRGTDTECSSTGASDHLSVVSFSSIPDTPKSTLSRESYRACAQPEGMMAVVQLRALDQQRATCSSQGSILSRSSLCSSTSSISSTTSSSRGFSPPPRPSGSTPPLPPDSPSAKGPRLPVTRGIAPITAEKSTKTAWAPTLGPGAAEGVHSSPSPTLSEADSHTKPSPQRQSTIVDIRALVPQRPHTPSEPENLGIARSRGMLPVGPLDEAARKPWQPATTVMRDSVEVGGDKDTIAPRLRPQNRPPPRSLPPPLCCQSPAVPPTLAMPPPPPRVVPPKPF
eukprot:RCo015365